MLRKKLGGYGDIESKDLNEFMKRFKFSNENQQSIRVAEITVHFDRLKFEEEAKNKFNLGKVPVSNKA